MDELNNTETGCAARMVAAPEANTESVTGAPTRREMVGGAAAGVGALAAAGAVPAAAAPPRRSGTGHRILADHEALRAAKAKRLRFAVARDLLPPRRRQAVNGDDGLYDDFRASFTKTLPHDGLGEVDRGAYRSLLRALSTRDGGDVERIRLDQTVRTRKLADPIAAYGFTLSGLDPQASRMLAAPTFTSSETGGEMLELYWKALLRDVPFSQFSSNAGVAAAASDLTTFGYTPGGALTPSTIFRGETAGDKVGPFISQFLLKPVPYGNGAIRQAYPRPADGADFMAGYAEWLTVQRGGIVGATAKSGEFYIHDGRSLAEYVHVDFTYQAYLNAALILLGLGPDFVAQGSPARTSTTTGSFVTFGLADILDVVVRAANQSLHAAWYQKWSVHRRLRPETYGGRLHNQLKGAKDYDLPAKLAGSDGVARTLSKQGNPLLSQCYPEGSPTHPAYPAGHATIAGACCTVLKAFFDGDAILPNPVEASADGSSLLPYGSGLTVGGEIDKLASNITLGRDWAGVHYRSDGIEGLRVGEEIALALLADRAACYPQDFEGFSLTRFDGRPVTVRGDQGPGRA